MYKNGNKFQILLVTLFVIQFLNFMGVTEFSSNKIFASNSATPLLELKEVGANFITLEFTFPIDGVYGNRLQLKNNSTQQWEFAQPDLYMTSGTYTFKNLDPDTSYLVRLSHLSEGEWHDFDTNVSTKSPLELKEAGAYFLTLEFAFLTDDEFGNRLQLKNNSTQQWEYAETDSCINSGSYTFENLDPDTSYLVRLSHYSEDEWHDFDLNVSTKSCLEIKDVGVNFLTIAADFPSDAVYTNILKLKNNSTQQWEFAQPYFYLRSGTYTFENLDPDTSYLVCLSYYNKDKWHDFEVNISTKSLIEIKETGTNFLTLEYTFPSDGVYENKLQLKNNSTQQWEIAQPDLYMTSGTYTFENLDSGTSYLARLSYYSEGELHNLDTNVYTKISDIYVHSFPTSVCLRLEKSSHHSLVVGYNIYRKESNSSSSPTLVASVVNNSAENLITYTDCGLTENTFYDYRIEGYNLSNDILTTAHYDAVKTSNNSTDIKRIDNLKLLVPIYTSSYNGKPAIDTKRVVNTLDKISEFYYRNSLGRLNLQIDYMFIDTLAPINVVNKNTTYDFIAQDLLNKGIQVNQYDLVYTIGNNIQAIQNGVNVGGLGGFYVSKLGETWGSLAFDHKKGQQSPFDKAHDSGDIYSGFAWLFTHEICHSIENLYNRSMSPRHATNMLSCHPPVNYPYVINNNINYAAGEHFDCIAQLLRVYDGYGRHNRYIEYIDSDNDGMAGIDFRLPIDEVRFSTNINNADTDNDGLNDMEEYHAGIYQASNPRNMDTSGDGIFDSDTITPLSDFSPVIEKFESSLDFSKLFSSTDSNWTKLGSVPSFQFDEELEATYYSGWDDDNLYIGVESNKKIKVWLSLDLSGENGRWQSNANVENTNSGTGDCYSGNTVLVIDPSASSVLKGPWGSPVDDSEIKYMSDDGKTHIMQIKIPIQNLGAGLNESYCTDCTKEFEDMTKLLADKILGFKITYSTVESSPNNTEFSGKWSSLNEVYHYNTTRLID